MSLSSSGITPSGIFNRAGLFDRAGIFNAFSPFSLNPFLYYDARSSMIASFEQPTLDLDPSNPSSLDIITATRAGVATYTDANGVVQSASPNTVRVDHVDGVPMILVEPAATNLVDYSNLDTSGIWYQLGFSVIQNEILSPDGLINGTKLEQTSTSKNLAGAFIPSAAETSVTYSFWIKKGSGSTHLNRFTIRNNSASPFNQRGAIDLDTGEIIQNEFGTGNLIVEAYPNGWFKVKATRDTEINIGDDVRIYPPYYSSDGTNEIGQYNYTFGHQLEYGSVATSYIPTNGSTVTRNADQLVISGSDFTDFYNASEGTVYVEAVTKDDNNGNACVFSISDGTSDNLIRSRADSGIKFFNIRVGASNHVGLSAGTLTSGETFRGAYAFKENSAQTSLNGGTLASDTSLTIPSVDRINIGSSFFNDNQLNGHIKRLIYWPYHSDDL